MNGTDLFFPIFVFIIVSMIILMVYCVGVILIEITELDDIKKIILWCAMIGVICAMIILLCFVGYVFLPGLI